MKLGVTSLSVTKAGRKRKRAAAGGGGDGSVVFDFTGGSLPAGMYQYTGSNAQPTLTWDSTGAKFSGDAGSGQYPLRLPTAFTGDYLFQLSTRIDETTALQHSGVPMLVLGYSSQPILQPLLNRNELQRWQNLPQSNCENPLFANQQDDMDSRIVVKFYKVVCCRWRVDRDAHVS